MRHGHDAEGREKYHVLPDTEHGHLHCSSCGVTWEVADEEASGVSAAFAARAFDVDLSRVTVLGRCARCCERETPESPSVAPVSALRFGWSAVAASG